MTLGISPAASQPSDSVLHLKSFSNSSKQSLPSIRSIRSKFQGSFRNRSSRTSKQNGIFASPSSAPSFLGDNDAILDIQNHTRSLSQGLPPVTSLVDLSQQPSNASLTSLTETTAKHMSPRRSLQPAPVPQRSGSLSSLRSSVRKRSESFKALSLGSKQGKSRSVPPASEIPQGRVSQVVTSLEHSSNSGVGRTLSLPATSNQTRTPPQAQSVSFPHSDFMPTPHFSSPAMSDGSVSSVSLRNRCNSVGYHRSISQSSAHSGLPVIHQENPDDDISTSVSSAHLDNTGDSELEPILENAESDLGHINISRDGSSLATSPQQDDTALSKIDNDVERKFISDIIANAYLGSTRQRSMREQGKLDTPLSPREAMLAVPPAPSSNSSSVRNSIEKSMHRFDTLFNLEHAANSGGGHKGSISYENGSSVDSFDDDQIVSPLDILIRELGGSTTPLDAPISPITPVDSVDQPFFGKDNSPVTAPITGPGPQIKVTDDVGDGVAVETTMPHNLSHSTANNSSLESLERATFDKDAEINQEKINFNDEDGDQLEQVEPGEVINEYQSEQDPDSAEAETTTQETKYEPSEEATTESHTSPETSQILLPQDTLSSSARSSSIDNDVGKIDYISSHASSGSVDHITSTSPMSEELDLVTPHKPKSWSLCELEESYARMKKLLDSNSKLADSAKSIYSTRLTSPLRDLELNPSVASLVDPISSRDSFFRSRHTSPSPLMQTSEPLPLVDDEWDELPFAHKGMSPYSNSSASALGLQALSTGTSLDKEELPLQCTEKSDDTSQDDLHRRDSINSGDNSDTIRQQSAKVDQTTITSSKSPTSMSNTISRLGGLKSQAGKELQAMILERSSKNEASSREAVMSQGMSDNERERQASTPVDSKETFNIHSSKIPRAWFENTPNNDYRYTYSSRVDPRSMPVRPLTHRRENSEPPAVPSGEFENQPKFHLPLDTIKKYDKIELFLKLIEAENELEGIKRQASSERNLLMDALRDSQQLVRELRRENATLRAERGQKQEFISTSPSRTQLRWAARSASPNLSLSGSIKPRSLASIRSNSDMFSPRMDIGRQRMDVRSLTPTFDGNVRSSSSLSLRQYNSNTTLPTPPPSATSEMPKYSRNPARHRTAPPLSGKTNSPNSRLKPPPLGYNYNTMRNSHRDISQRTPSLESTFASKLAGFHDTPLLHTRIPSTSRWGSTASTPTSLGHQDSRGSLIPSARPRSLGPNEEEDDDHVEEEEENDRVIVQENHYTTAPSNYNHNYSHQSKKSYSPLKVPSNAASHSRSFSASSNVSSTFGEEHVLPPLRDSWHPRRNSVTSIENVSLGFTEHDRRFLDDLENDFVPPDGFDEQTSHILPMLTSYK